MTMVWDEAKRRTNIEKHGLDFADAAERFVWETADVARSHAGARGGERFTAVGLLDDRLVVLAFSLLGTEAVSAISLRPASRKERIRHDQGSASGPARPR